MLRIKQYAGWGENREMAFESTQGSGDFLTSGRIPVNAADLLANYRKGERFIYTGDKSKSPAIFNLSDEDIKQLTADPANFDYLVYAKVDPAIIALGDAALGKTLNLANVKNVSVTNSTTDFVASYTANASFDLDAIVKDYEKNVQEGGAYVARIKYYDPTTGELTGPWYNISGYRNTYTIGGVEYGPGLKTTEVVGNTNWDYFNLGGMFNFANLGDATKVGTQSITYDKVTSKQGKFTYEFSIESGDVGPGFVDLTPKSGSSYYSVVGGHLTATPASILTGNNILAVKEHKNGQAESYFNGRKLMLINILVLNAETVAAAKKAGVNLENADALEQFVSKR